jgi:hypothetical protein
MCMEDIRLGRKLASHVSKKPLTVATVTPVAPANGNRTRITFCGDGVNLATFLPSAETVANGVGFPINSTIPSITLRIEDIGPIIQSSWDGFCQAAGPTITVIDCSLSEK